MTYTTYQDGDDYVIKVVDTHWMQPSGINYKDEVRIPKDARFLQLRINKALRVMERRHAIAKRNQGST